MEREERIRQIAKAIPHIIGNEHRYLVAEALVDAGYGNVKEFVNMLTKNYRILLDNEAFVVIKIADLYDLLKEFTE